MLFVASVFSCSSFDETPLPSVECAPLVQKSEISTSEAQREFALALSRAIYDNVSMRRFIQTEAMKMFDNDHDVFYPFIKDKEVETGLSFRDVILHYLTEDSLSSIESALPLLTIMMPDLSFANGFNVEDWNPEEKEVSASYVDGNKDRIFYCNGDSVASLGRNELPCFPYMVVKNNERMRISSVHTRSGNQSLQYEFVDDVFNPAKRHRVKTRSSDYGDYVNVDTIDQSLLEKTWNCIDTTLVDNRVIMACAVNRNSPECTRDYIYYGIKDSIDGNEGHLRPHYNERLYKFKVTSSCYDVLTDGQNATNVDPVIPSGDENFLSNRTVPLEDSVLVSFFNNVWSSGHFEFVITSFLGNRNGTSTPVVKYLDVEPKDLFQVASVHYYHDPGNFWAHSHYQYKLFPEDIIPKWVDVTLSSGGPIYLLPGSWDLTEKSLMLYIKVQEYDPSVEVTNTFTDNMEFASMRNFSWSTDEYIKITTGISENEKTSSSIFFSETIHGGNDELGSVVLNYTDPIILKAYSENGFIHPLNDIGPGLFKVYTYNTGRVQLMILPSNIVND